MKKDSNKRSSLNLLAYGGVLLAAGVVAFLTRDAWMQALGGPAASVPAASGHDHGSDDHAGHDHAGHDHAGHDHAGHDHAGHDHAGHDHAGHDHAGHDHAGHDHAGHDHGDLHHENGDTLTLSVQAKRNLKLAVKKAFPQTFWKRLIIPGEIIDRPGLTDRSVASPIAGVVTEVHAQQGDIIKPGDRLVTIRLVSDYLQKAQADLYKAVRETDILNQEIARIQTMADRGIIPEKRIIQLRQDIERQTSQVESGRQDLLARGFNESQVAKAERGNFLTSIELNAPTTNDNQRSERRIEPITDVVNQATEVVKPDNQFFEVQELISELGHQVAPGEQIAVLSDHQHLYIRGHAFKKEAANLERVMENRWNVGVEFVEDSPGSWPKLNRSYKVRHLSNEVDPESRTFDFFVSMENQSRIYQNEDRTAVVWRFRPGQRVRLKVPVEKIENVLVLPAAAVVRDGAEVYAFQSVGKYFRRVAVHQIYQDRDNVVLANDGSLPKAASMAQNAAASLNRVLKSQTNAGSQEFHVHADGTVHSNDDH